MDYIQTLLSFKMRQGHLTIWMHTRISSRFWESDVRIIFRKSYIDLMQKFNYPSIPKPTHWLLLNK